MADPKSSDFQAFFVVPYWKGQAGTPRTPTTRFSAIGGPLDKDLAEHVGSSTVPATLLVPNDYEPAPTFAGAVLRLIGIFWLFSDEIAAVYGAESPLAFDRVETSSRVTSFKFDN